MVDLSTPSFGWARTVFAVTKRRHVRAYTFRCVYVLFLAIRAKSRRPRWFNSKSYGHGGRCRKFQPRKGPFLANRQAESARARVGKELDANRQASKKLKRGNA